MKDFLLRQAAAYEGALSDSVALEAAMDGTEFGELLERQSVYQQRTAQLNQEYALLAREWDGTQPQSDVERVELSRLVARVVDLGNRLSSQNARLLEQLERRAAAIKKEMDRIRRSRGALGKYRSGAPPGDGFMDTKA